LGFVFFSRALRYPARVFHFGVSVNLATGDPPSLA
jgi:hypothetical protein